MVVSLWEREYFRVWVFGYLGDLMLQKIWGRERVIASYWKSGQLLGGGAMTLVYHYSSSLRNSLYCPRVDFQCRTAVESEL